MTTRAPNEQSPRQPDAGGARNDVGIDPQGDVPASAGSTGGPGRTGGTEAGSRGDASTPKGNDYSPDFKPKQDEEKLNKPKDADIDTDGG